MPAVRVTPPPSLDSVDLCENCGGTSIDLWKCTTGEKFICKNCLLDNEQHPPGDILLCPGSMFGCEYQTGTARNCVNHLRTCPRRPTLCPNECSSIVANFDLPKHLTDGCPRRTQECRFCHGNYFVSEMTSHFKDCKDYTVACQYCNKENIRRGSLEEHGAGCRMTPKACKMAALGCTFKAGDNEMERHVTLEKHAFFIHDLKMQVNILEAEVRRLREERHREKLEQQKVEDILKNERQIRDEEVKKLRIELQSLVVQFGELCGRSSDMGDS